MRMSWFTGSQLLRRRARRPRRRSAAQQLRVRQLERRRVLDGAVASVVASAVTASDAPATQTTTTDTASQQQVSFDWTPPESSSQAASNSSLVAQGAAMNVPPVAVVPLTQNVNEGQLLDLSGMSGAPPLGLFIDPDLADTHTATVDWGDGSAIQNTSVIQGIGAGAWRHSCVCRPGDVYRYDRRDGQ